MGAPLGVLVGAAVHVETPVLILVVMDVRTPAQRGVAVAGKHVPRHAQGTAEECHRVDDPDMPEGKLFKQYVATI